MSQDTTLLRFIEVATKQFEVILTHLHALEQTLIEKGLTTEEALLSKVKEAESLPNRIVGVKALNEMIADYKKPNQTGA
jgi:hypothetical protein